jgi:hypothetical protein
LNCGIDTKGKSIYVEEVEMVEVVEGVMVVLPDKVAYLVVVVVMGVVMMVMEGFQDNLVVEASQGQVAAVEVKK